MALVNLQAPGDACTWIDHPEWSSLTAADLVFPFFLVAVGLSTAYAFDERRPVRWQAVLRRTALLFAIGLALNWALHPSPDPGQLRLSGVLQRIAVVYLACAFVAGRTGGWRTPLGLAVALLALHGAILLGVRAPGEAAPSLARGAGVSGWLDRTLIPLRLYRRDYDPEGVLSTVSAIATGLLGLAAVRARRAGASDASLALAAAATIAGGLALTPALPLNKALWTPSFALVTGGAGGLAWLGLGALAERSPRALRGPAWVGRRALDFYVLHMLLIAVLVLKLGGPRIWTRLSDPLASGLRSPGWGSMLFAGLAAAGCIALKAVATPRSRVLRL